MTKEECKCGSRILLLGAYSMEVVECGGALLKNAMHGGISHAAIAFAGGQMREDLKKSAEILKTSVEFLDMDVGRISASYEEKLSLIKTIRQFDPDIIITQDTEHCVCDLDPGRRPFMTLVLEAIALAGRNYAMDELPGLKPSRGAAIYFMTPEHPNCVVDISDVWEQKCAAMDALSSQLVHFGRTHPDHPEAVARCKALVPNWENIESELERGKLAKRALDKAFYMYPHSTGHCRALYAEPYRKEGHFVLNKLRK